MFRVVQCRLQQCIVAEVDGVLGWIYVSAFCLVCEWGNDGSRAAAEVFKGVCMCLRASVSLI